LKVDIFCRAEISLKLFGRAFDIYSHATTDYELFSRFSLFFQRILFWLQILIFSCSSAKIFRVIYFWNCLSSKLFFADC
jgi:hypothetical protein